MVDEMKASLPAMAGAASIIAILHFRQPLLKKLCRYGGEQSRRFRLQAPPSESSITARHKGIIQLRRLVRPSMCCASTTVRSSR
jgi:hypothetical protein